MSAAIAPVRIKIDFVSDVSCPWCIVGLRALELALERLRDEVVVDIQFQPFELNPDMPPEGQDANEHLTRKYGSTPAQLAQSREALRARGAALGFEFNLDQRRRVYNTFDAHRLLHWAAEHGRQLALKHALFSTYFSRGEDVSDHATLTRVAGEAGLNAADAAAVLASARYGDEVRTQEHFYRARGINAVPAVILNDRHLISGGQPVEVFEQALRKVAGEI